MATPVYATVDDYVLYTGVPAPMEIPPRVMAQASAAIDTALVGAVYATGDGDVPTDPEVSAALRDATCAQARPAVECTGKDGGQPGDRYLTVEAFDILRGAGLLPITPQVWG